MTKKPVKSTVFRSGCSPSKSEQERLVGELFAEGYEQTTGIKLQGNIRGGDPPDRLFYCRRLRIGVEMFELGQFYEARALLNDLTDEIYSEFESRRVCERYERIVINVPILTDIKTAKALITRWQQKGIGRKQKSTFAKEFVNLFGENVPSRDAIPEGDRGLIIQVDPALYPAVSTLTKNISIHRCPTNTPLRTDGKAAPLVIISPGYHIKDSEIEESIKSKMVEKIQARPSWKSAVDHSVLVAHDIPRGRVYVPLAVEANKWLLRAASRVDLLQTFDELWFVTPIGLVSGGKMIRAKAQQVCGKQQVKVTRLERV